MGFRVLGKSLLAKMGGSPSMLELPVSLRAPIIRIIMFGDLFEGPLIGETIINIYIYMYIYIEVHLEGLNLKSSTLNPYMGLK